MSAFVRSPSKLPLSLRNDVNIIKGDVLKREEVEDAIQGHDFVLSALGTGWSTGQCILCIRKCYLNTSMFTTSQRSRLLDHNLKYRRRLLSHATSFLLLVLLSSSTFHPVCMNLLDIV